MLELEVMPERGLSNGQWELTLGTPLVQCIHILQSNYTVIKSVQLSYSESTPLQHNIVLDMTEDGVKLNYDSKTQLLKSIEVYDLKRVKLKYCNSVFSAPGITPTLEVIRRCFGPTRAGDKNVKQQLYLLLFRGIVFVFPLDRIHTSTAEFTTGTEDECIESSIERSLVLSWLRIFSGNNPTDPLLPSIPCDFLRTHSHANSILGMCDQEHGDHIISLSVSMMTTPEDAMQNRLMVTNSTQRTVSFMDTAQDVMIEVGSPNQIFYKDEDKMKIHSASIHKRQQLSSTSDYFYNYFALGLDILFDGNSHTVKKFVLHTNYPGHYNFGRYHRCNFTLSFPSDASNNIMEDNDSQLTSVTAFTKWNEVQDVLGSKSDEKPVVLCRSSSTNNTNPFGYTYCYNYRNVIFEVMKNSHIASIVIFKP